MPQLRQMRNGLTRIRFHMPEERAARKIAKLLRYVAQKRDGDDMLTQHAGTMAEQLEALCDALAKPVKVKPPEPAPAKPAKKRK